MLVITYLLVRSFFVCIASKSFCIWKHVLWLGPNISLLQIKIMCSKGVSKNISLSIEISIRPLYSVVQCMQRTCKIWNCMHAVCIMCGAVPHSLYTCSVLVRIHCIKYSANSSYTQYYDYVYTHTHTRHKLMHNPFHTQNAWLYKINGCFVCYC